MVIAFRIGAIVMLITGLSVRIIGDTYYRLLLKVERDLIIDGVSNAPIELLIALPFVACHLISVILIFAKPKHWLFLLIPYPMLFCFALWYFLNGPVFFMEEPNWLTVYYHFTVLLILVLLAAFVILRNKAGRLQRLQG